MEGPVDEIHGHKKLRGGGGLQQMRLYLWGIVPGIRQKDLDPGLKSLVCISPPDIYRESIP